jgi:RNA polymerase sigma-70 factor (ECF subfamily)
VKAGQLIQLRPLARIEDLSDEGLAAACAIGDRAAQGLVFERHVDSVHGFIARMRGADSTLVDDLVQATFMAAFRSAGNFKGPRLRNWLYGIAANVVRSHIRKEVARRRVVTTLGDEPIEHDVKPADVDVAKLLAAIATLSPKLREVLVLVDLEGERGTDVAAALGIPEGTVWRRLSVARQQLRAALGDES